MRKVLLLSAIFASSLSAHLAFAEDAALAKKPKDAKIVADSKKIEAPKADESKKDEKKVEKK
jgi:hypothetical protein